MKQEDFRNDKVVLLEFLEKYIKFNEQRWIKNEDGENIDNLENVILNTEFKDLKSFISFCFTGYYCYKEYTIKEMIIRIERLIEIENQEDEALFFNDIKECYYQERSVLRIIDNNTQEELIKTFNTYLHQEIKEYTLKEYNLFHKLIDIAFTYHRDNKTKKWLHLEIQYLLIFYFNKKILVEGNKRTVFVEDITISFQQKNKNYEKLTADIFNYLTNNIHNKTFKYILDNS